MVYCRYLKLGSSSVLLSMLFSGFLLKIFIVVCGGWGRRNGCAVFLIGTPSFHDILEWKKHLKKM